MTGTASSPRGTRRARFPCPVCAGATRKLPGSQPSLVDGVVFRLHRCSACRHVFRSIAATVPRFAALVEAAVRYEPD